eukprot:gene16833-18532_t
MASRTTKMTSLLERGRGQTSLFKDVSFYLVDETKDEPKNILKQFGAKREFYISDLVTHVIADDVDFPEYEQVKDAKLDVVKSTWVDACIRCETILPQMGSLADWYLIYLVVFCSLTHGSAKPFSPEVNAIFSGLTMCLSQISKSDRDALWAMVTYHGGNCQPNLNAKCTHLICGKASGRKFDCAIQHVDRLKIVTPDWVPDCIKANSRINEEEYYPIEEAPKTPDSARAIDASHSRQQVTPKLNEGKPSALLTPVTPSQGSELKAVSPKKPHPPTSPVSEADDNDVKDAENSAAKINALSTDKTGNPNADVSMPLSAAKREPMTSECPPQMLKGFVFVFADYMERLSEETFKIWLDVIVKYGGEIEKSYSSRCTHFLCLHQQGDDFKKALTEGKKIATAHWLNEVLMQKEMFVPAQPLHFPVPFSNLVTGCKDMLISVSGYTGMERVIIKNIVSILGATYTGYFTQAHTHLICKRAEGPKYEKAIEWGISIVNAKWLGDMLQAGQAFPCTGLARYTKLGEADEMQLNEEYAEELLAAWKAPAEKPKPPPEPESAKPKKRKPSDSSEKIQKAVEPSPKQRKPDNPEEKTKVNVLFTGLTGPAVHTYSQMLKKMKGEIAKGVKNCTHLIAPKITRTVKFLSAISVVSHIVTPPWIEDSFKASTLLDEQEYALKDPESEEYFGFKLDISMQRSRTRKVFQGLKFFVTPNITPSPIPMKEIIECAGGEMFELKEGEASMSLFIDSKMKKKDNSYVVTCEEDRSIWEPLHKDGHEVYNVELVLSGVMKQELEWDSYPFI